MSEKTMFPHFRRNIRGWHLAVIIVFLVAAYMIFRYFYPDVGFAYFEPVYLPPNVSIKEKRIYKSPYATAVEQNFRTEDWVYEIQEGKSVRPAAASAENYDPSSVKPTCHTGTTPARTQYRVCHWIDYGRINVHEVTFDKGGTEIYSQIPTATSQEIPFSQIEKYIDSFQRHSTSGIPVLCTSGGA